MCPLDVKRRSCRSPKFIVEAYRRPPSDGSGLRRGSDVSVRFTPTSPLARSTYTLTVTRYWATSTKSTLAPMTRTGLVKRTVTPTVPPQVSYSHTPLGADLTVQLWGLVSWIGNHTNDILEAQVRHDAATIHP
jgi:hypothetical protein